MATYQLYVFGPDHSLLYALEIEGGSDDEAAAIAAGHAADHAAEIWRDGRFIRRIGTQPPND